jgi:hypothetical protein
MLVYNLTTRSKMITLSGNINRKIFNAKTGNKIKTKTVNEAHSIYVQAKKLGVDVTRRGCDLVFHGEIDKLKYEWTSGEPAKATQKPSLRSVE